VLYRENIGEAHILNALRPLFERFGKERTEGEPFGDFVLRMDEVAPMLEGRNFQRVTTTPGPA
jgi:sulfite reductase (NADPH) hemoprotein beta-component